MGDELHFYIFSADNNLNLKNITKSALFIGKFPSLENIFSEIENQEKNTTEWVEDIKESIEDISSTAEDINLDLLKSDDITWEQKEQLERTFSNIEDIANYILNVKTEDLMYKIILKHGIIYQKNYLIIMNQQMLIEK